MRSQQFCDNSNMIARTLNILKRNNLKTLHLPTDRGHCWIHDWGQNVPQPAPKSPEKVASSFSTGFWVTLGGGKGGCGLTALAARSAHVRCGVPYLLIPPIEKLQTLLCAFCCCFDDARPINERTASSWRCSRPLPAYFASPITPYESSPDLVSNSDGDAAADEKNEAAAGSEAQGPRWNSSPSSSISSRV